MTARTTLIAVATALALTGCASSRYDSASYTGRAGVSMPAIPGVLDDRSWHRGGAVEQAYDYDAIYAATYDGGFDVPAVDWRRIGRDHLRQRVPFDRGYKPGTIVVDVASRHLYHVERGGTAMRYGIAVGRDGFGWGGSVHVGRKASWPKWFPPAEMIERKPELEEHRFGMEGGPDNPIGARGLYLFRGGKDTLYRIHGTNQPYTIGSAASSGCFRMLSQDVIHLHERVRVGAEVVVLQGSQGIAAL